MAVPRPAVPLAPAANGRPTEYFKKEYVLYLLELFASYKKELTGKALWERLHKEMETRFPDVKYFTVDILKAKVESCINEGRVRHKTILGEPPHCLTFLRAFTALCTIL